MTRGYLLFHDVPLRGYGNIDHVAVGPGGVFTIETKNATGTARIRRGKLRENGRLRDEYIAQAHRQVLAVLERVRRDPLLDAADVVPVLCSARATVDVGRSGTGVVDGVRVAGPRGVKRFIERSAASLTQEMVDGAVAALSSTPDANVSSAALTLTTRPMPRCSCGSEMLLRRRKSDGKPFYGCSRFPVCRETRPCGLNRSRFRTPKAQESGSCIFVPDTEEPRSSIGERLDPVGLAAGAREAVWPSHGLRSGDSLISRSMVRGAPKPETCPNAAMAV